MNLYLRLAWLFICHLFQKKKKISLFSEHNIAFRVMPFDVDINLHLTNSRYFAFCDLARTDLLLKSGLLKPLLKQRCLPVVAATEVSFFKAIHPLQKFNIQTQLVGWDKKYWYIEHRFICHGNVYASLTIRGSFLRNKVVVPTEEVLSLGQALKPSPDLPPSIKLWIEVLEEKKRARSR